jgi:hypothetical protein
MRSRRIGRIFFVMLTGAGLVIGVLVLASIGLRISGFLGGPGYDLFSIPSAANGADRSQG